MLDVGRVCVKTAGREAGSCCVIVNKVDSKFVTITGPKALTQVKRRKCNIEHLEPLPYTLKISKDASDEDVLSAYSAEKLYEKLNLKPLTKEEIKVLESMKAEKAVQKKATEEKRKAEEAKKAKEASKPAKSKEAKPAKPKPEAKPAEAKKPVEAKKPEEKKT